MVVGEIKIDTHGRYRDVPLLYAHRRAIIHMEIYIAIPRKGRSDVEIERKYGV